MGNTIGVVDYSWFIMDYRFPAHYKLPPLIDRAKMKGVARFLGGGKPWCFQSLQSDRTNTSAHVLCLSTIDLTLEYKGALMAMESKLMSEKWHGYANKFRKFTKCLFGMPPPSGIKI